jgi:hypothetical protein
MNPQTPAQNNDAATVSPVTASTRVVNESTPAYPAFLDRTRILTARGIPVVPVDPGQKRCTLSGWPTLATTDPNIISLWAQQYPDANTAAVCLAGGVCVVDADVAGLMSRIEQECGQKVPRTLVVKSGGKGLPHV